MFRYEINLLQTAYIQVLFLNCYFYISVSDRERRVGYALGMDSLGQECVNPPG